MSVRLLAGIAGEGKSLNTEHTEKRSPQSARRRDHHRVHREEIATEGTEKMQAREEFPRGSAAISSASFSSVSSVFWVFPCVLCVESY
jgi:hypothetical protein